METTTEETGQPFENLTQDQVQAKFAEFEEAFRRTPYITFQVDPKGMGKKGVTPILDSTNVFNHRALCTALKELVERNSELGHYPIGQVDFDPAKMDHQALTLSVLGEKVGGSEGAVDAYHLVSGTRTPKASELYHFPSVLVRTDFEFSAFCPGVEGYQRFLSTCAKLTTGFSCSRGEENPELMVAKFLEGTIQVLYDHSKDDGVNLTVVGNSALGERNGFDIEDQHVYSGSLPQLGNLFHVLEEGLFAAQISEGSLKKTRTESDLPGGIEVVVYTTADQTKAGSRMPLDLVGSIVQPAKKNAFVASGVELECTYALR